MAVTDLQAEPRPCEAFMRQRGVLLADHGFIPDPGRIEVTDSTVVLYHYTRDERAERVLEAGGGLWARLPVVSAPPGLEGHYSSRGCWSRCRFG